MKKERGAKCLPRPFFPSPQQTLKTALFISESKKCLSLTRPQHPPTHALSHTFSLSLSSLSPHTPKLPIHPRTLSSHHLLSHPPTSSIYNKLCSFLGKTYILQWRSKAFTRAKSLWLLRTLIKTCELFFTLCIRTERGPFESSSSSGILSSMLVTLESNRANQEGKNKHQGWRRKEANSRKREMLASMKSKRRAHYKTKTSPHLAIFGSLRRCCRWILQGSKTETR